ncbi:hypothetical protein FHR72_000296 [Mycolicibacterium iranicum]|uniref:Integral membrane protein n=1 Tax=Mycolicibacterium iranicum TaxID=912594 RepID=A0A839PZG1_MYCIR|nr:hypothetical protein [Mycolicibacterium iranicum]MBB2988839.1 hypothetical protein [Mycolicibacterium iranicum]
MTPTGTRLLPLAFGFLMVGAAAYHADGPALVAAGVAAVAVIASAWLRPAATVAVVLAVLTIVLGGSAPMHTVLAGLAAAMYLAMRHSDPTVPTVSFTVGSAVAATLVIALPVQVPWLPLAAPLALLAAYLLALKPFLAWR